jgi:hypothetical protein
VAVFIFAGALFLGFALVGYVAARTLGWIHPAFSAMAIIPKEFARARRMRQQSAVTQPARRPREPNQQSSIVRRLRGSTM